MKWRRIVVVILLILFVGGGIAAYIYTTRSTSTQVRTTTVSRATVAQDVSFTGRLEAARVSNIGFTAGGIINAINVSVGDVVQVGDVLVAVDPRTAQLDSSKAAADLASGQETYKIAFDQSKVTYEKTKTSNAQQISEQTQVVKDKKKELDQARAVYQQRADDEGEDSYLAKAAYSSYLSALSVYNGAQQSLTLLRKTVDASNTTAKQAVEAAEQQYLSTTQASGSVAGLSSLKALYNRSLVALSLYSIKAPFTGTVTQVNAEIGEYAAPGASAITIETTQDVSVKAQATETDAIKLANDMPATITFDAIANESWSGHVTSIAPSAVVVDGVPSYEVTIKLDTTNQELRPGLTADVTVHARKQDNALSIPRRAVVEHDGKSFVRIPTQNGEYSEKEVQTGLVGSDGNIEVISGLSEGESIVLSVQDES